MPSHIGVQGKKRADEAVKMMAETRAISACPKQSTSLARIRRTVTERKWKEAKHWFQCRHEGCSHIQLGWYDSALEAQGPDEVAM